MTITEQINNVIVDCLKDLGIKRPKVSLEHPNDLSHGDYSTSVAMVYAKKLNMSPLDVAVAIVARFNKEKLKYLDKVEIAGFGFINFYLSQDFFEDTIKDILRQKENFGKDNYQISEKVIIDYTDPNLFKEFHIGHLMSNAIGESISRLMEWKGADLRRACYQGDVGLHVAKAIYGIKKLKFEFLRLNLLGNPLKRAQFLGKAYVLGASSYENDSLSKKDIVDLNKEIYLRNNPTTNRYYDIGRKWSLEYFDYVYKILGTKFDFFFFESQTADPGLEIVNHHLKDGLFTISDKAVVFKGEDYGLHTRVFVNSEGLPTYEAKDLGLVQLKHDEFNYDSSIIITANEQNDYFKVIIKVIDLIYPHLSGKTFHIGHGMMRLPSGLKMSSRSGNVTTALSLIDEVKERIKDKVKDRGWDYKTEAEIVKQVSLGAIKFSILKQAAGKDIAFDLDRSLSFDGDSGPYLQYSYARARSVLTKAKQLNIKSEVLSGNKPREITGVEKIIYRFPEVVNKSAEEKSPHHLVGYLLELASAFNSFYANTKIINHPENQTYYLALTESFTQIMKQGLYLLAIETPEKM